MISMCLPRSIKEVEIEFDYEDLIAHEPGFMEESEWMQYSLSENAFNSLKDFLDGKITGNQYNREKQLEAFSKINANTDGTCGKTIYEYIKEEFIKSVVYEGGYGKSNYIWDI